MDEKDRTIRTHWKTHFIMGGVMLALVGALILPPLLRLRKNARVF